MIRRGLLLAIAAITVATGAHADARPGVEIKFVGLSVARPGVPINAEVHIKPAQAMTLKQFQFGMRGTTVSSDAPLDSLVIPANTTQVLHLNVTPGPSSDELVFECTADGQKIVRKRNLSQYWSDIRNYGVICGFDPQPDPPVMQPTQLASVLIAPEVPLPALAQSPWQRPVVTPEQAMRRADLMSANATTETHEVYGRIRYQLPDNSKEEVDGAAFTIWVKTSFGDIPVASGSTDRFGIFDKTFVIPSTFGRTFYVSFRTTNGWVHVLNNDDDDDPYFFKTNSWNGPVGGGLSNKVFLATNTDVTPALHMLTSITRGFRFVLANTSFTYPDDIDDIDASWPESDWPHYLWPYYETLYIPDASWAWKTKTLLHEFGHHVNWELPMEINQTSYGDGNCESPGEDGRHCRWCGEDDLNVATVEGFASWFADEVEQNWWQDYGSHPYQDDQNELVSGTMDTPCPGGWNGDRTEGFFWALLRDLADDTNEADPNYDANQFNLPSLHTAPEDRLSLGFAAVLDIFIDYDINIVQDFKTAFFARYNGSLDHSDIWNTFANAGYWYDTTAPFPVTNIHSTDHTANISSPDNSISFVWDPAVEAQSGVYDHNIWLYRVGTGIVGTGPNAAHPETNITFSDLSPGTYYLKVAAIDAAGNVNNTTIGQSPNYVVRDPTPTDLEKWLRTGWDDEIVARSTNGATSGSVHLTPYLPGDKDSTYLNWAVQNSGETPVPNTYRTRLLIDGVVVDSVTSIAIGGVPVDDHTILNRGRYLIRGGRHTLELWTDAAETIAEASETDNRWGVQYVWKPLTVARGADLVKPAPPRRAGGSNVIPVPIGGTRFYNCDGHRYTHNSSFFPITTTRWIASELWSLPSTPDRNGVDYDLQLGYTSDGPLDGFTDGLITSSRGPNLTDAVITNAINMGTTSFDLGVYNMLGDDDDYHLRVNAGGTTAVGDSAVLTLEANQMVVLRDIDVTAADVGKIVLTLRRTGGTGQVQLAYLGSSTDFATLSTASGTTIMGAASNLATTSFTASAAGHWCALMWRDPEDGTGVVTAVLKAAVKPPDLAIVTPSGWSAPLIPRPANDATTSNAPYPAILYGDDKPTWLSVSKRNASDVASGFNNMQVLLDGQSAWTGVFSGLAPLTTYPNPNIASRILPGGRHVLSLLLDQTNVMPELSELNNTYGRQYVWTPDTVASDAAQWRPGQIGGVTAGWEYCLPGSYLYFDMDGIRLPVWGSGSGVDFAAVALTPRDSADVDLGLYLTRNTSTDGFDVPQEDSNWGPGQTDLLLLSFAAATRKAYDIGIQRVTDDTTSYALDVVPGVVRNPSTPIHGPFAMPASRLVHVHQFALPIGRYTFHLRNLAGSVDWALALYDAERPFQDRSQGEERGWSYLNGPGADEEIVFVAEQPMTVALVVFKSGSGEASKAGSYQIELNTNPTDAPGGSAVGATRLAGAYPNPFRDDAAVHFDLAREGDVTLEVFDLRGARVRTLAHGAMAAGRHHVAWDGRDAGGRRMPGGVYLVRMLAPGYSGQAKVVRMN